MRTAVDDSADRTADSGEGRRSLPVRRLLLAALIVLLVTLAIFGDLDEAVGDLPRLALAWVRHNGLWGAVLALYVEESGVPVLLPGDVFIVYLGRHLGSPAGWVTAWLAIILAVVMGSTNLYWISRRWGRDLLSSRLGRLVHVTPGRMQRAERWFQRYGVWALIFGRHVPGLRVPITICAGTLRVRYPVFALSVAVSTAMWAGVFLFVGVRFGREFEGFMRAHRLGSTALLVTLGLLAIGYLAHRWAPRLLPMRA